MKVRAYQVTRWTRFAGVITDARRASRAGTAGKSGLAEHGPFLPHGLQVDLPDIATTSTVQTVQLWD